MKGNELIISPKTKIGELLSAFPQLEEVLLELSPSFTKLKNPIIRKTVGHVASLQQVAIIGGLKVDELVNRLRKEVRQDESAGESGSDQYLSESLPDWFNPAGIIHRIDASPVINAGGSPMAEILAQTRNLQPGESLELRTPFTPAPIIDMLRNKGFKTFSLQKEDEVISYFIKD